MRPINPPTYATASNAVRAGVTVFAALGTLLMVPNAADRFAVSHREVLFAM